MLGTDLLPPRHLGNNCSRSIRLRTIRPFSSSLQRRRRPTPVRISTRPRGREVSNISSTIYVNRSLQTDPHLQIYRSRRKVRSKDRLRSNGSSCWNTTSPQKYRKHAFSTHLSH